MKPIKNDCWKVVLPLNAASRLAIIVLAVAVGSIACSKVQLGDNGASSLSLEISEEELQILGTHISPTIAAKFTRDGKWLVVAGTDGVTLHDASTNRCVHWFNGQLVEVSPDGASILLEFSSGPPELWSIPDAKLIWRLPHDIQASQMHFSDDGRYIVCGYQSLLRIETREVVYDAPTTYSYDPIQGGDVFRNPTDPFQRNDDQKSQAKQSVLPYIYRTALRHDARPLITPGSGLCSPAGRFMIVQTGEKDTTYEPYYSVINRKTEGRILEEVSSAKALFFHDDQYLYHAESVYRTSDGKRLYSLPEGVMSVAINSDETMLAIGWQSGHVAVLDPLSGNELFRFAVDENIEGKQRKVGHVVALAFSKDSKRLAAVSSKLTQIDISSQSIVSALHLGSGSHREGSIAFNADGSLLLLAFLTGLEHRPSRARVSVFQATDLRQQRNVCSPDYHLPLQPVYFNPDGKYAIVPKDGRGLRSNQLRLWDTDSDQSITDISPYGYEWIYGDLSDVLDSPKRHLGLGMFRGWSAHDFVFHPWTVDGIASSNAPPLSESAKQWLDSFVQLSPAFASWRVNQRALHHPEKQWVLRFNNIIDQLYDLSTGETHPQDSRPRDVQQAREFESKEVPETCWGCHPSAIAFSRDGSRLLVYSDGHHRGNEFLALFEMPSGKLIRNYEVREANIDEIRIAPNNRIAAFSTARFEKTRVIDLETGAALFELPKGGKCVFSSDSRFAQVSDIHGKCQQLLRIEKGDQIGIEWAKYHWSFSPNCRFAVGQDTECIFLDLSTGEKMKIGGAIPPTGSERSLSNFPYQGNRFLCVDRKDTSLIDVNAAKVIATFNPVEIAHNAHAKNVGKTLATFALNYLYTRDEQHFVGVFEGEMQDRNSVEPSRRASETHSKEYSTQVLIGDLATGQQVLCTEPNWSRSRLQHKFFTPDGTHLITIGSDKMMCWRLQPLEIAWETRLSERWTDRVTGGTIGSEVSLGWPLDYAICPGGKSILIAADGREAILFNLSTGSEEKRFGELPINSVVRFGADGKQLQVGFRSNQSMRLYDVSTGEFIKTVHFTNEGAELHRFGPKATKP